MNTSSRPYSTWQAYLQLGRVNRPIGFWLLLWPTYWGLWIASHGHVPWLFLLSFTAGTWLMRTAGCIMNDCVDRRLDQHVERTRQRPLACGALSLRQALAMLALCLLAALGCLLMLPWQCMPIAMIAVAISFLYPFCKRWTGTPQVVLGMAFSLGIPMAFVAMQQPFALNTYLVWAAAMLWPIAYDSIYALMDQKDDISIGIRSTAITWGAHTVWVILCIEVMMAILWLCMAYRLGMRMTAVAATIIFIGFSFYNQWQLRKAKPNLQRLFNQQHYVGALLWLCLVVYFGW